MDQESGTSRLRDRDPPISTSCAFIYALVLIFSLLRSISNEARVARDRSYRRSPRVCTLLIYLFLRGRAIRKWQVVVLTRGNRNSFKEIVEKYFRLVSPVCLHFFFLVVFLGKKKKFVLISFVRSTYFKKYIYRYLQSYPRHISRSSFPIDRA